MTNLNEQVQQILVENGLNFTIHKQPMFTELNGNRIETDYFGLINSKTNNVINTVKDSYHVSQNKDIVELALLGANKFTNDLSISKAGSLNEGRKVYIQFKIEGIKKIGGDSIIQYVTLLDSNDGSTSLSIGIGDKCMRCQNEFRAFYKKGNAKFRHTATLEQKMKEIPTLIKLALDMSMEQINRYNTFQSTKVSKELAHSMVKHVLGYDRKLTSVSELSGKSTRAINIMEQLYNDIETEINQIGEVSLWSLFNGVTRYTTHNISTPTRENGRIESILSGNAYNFNEKAMEFALAHV